MAKFFKIPFAATGDTLAVPDATQPDGSVSYSQGFGPDYQRKTDGSDPLAKTVPRNQTNALFNDLTGAVGEIQLNGVPAWQSAGAPYPINAIVRHNNKNWTSQVANNSVTPVEGASWSEQPANSYTKAQVDTELATKANSATTLSGYGITNAYTKTETDSLLSAKANKSTTLSGYGITDAYTKVQTDGFLSAKADNATTLSGYGITDAYTKTQVDTALSGKANTATTLGGYGISDAYTKTEGDARYLRLSNNLSDLPNKATARSNLQLGTAAQATVVTSVTDSTAGRAIIVGSFGLGAALSADSTSLNEDGVTGFRGYAASTEGAPTTNAGAAIVIKRSTIPTLLAVDYVTGAFYIRPFGTSAWERFYTTGNVSAFAQTLLDDTSSTQARTTLDVIDGVGVRQSYSDVTASRATATTYTNSTGKPILVIISMNSSSNRTFTVNGLALLTTTSSTELTNISVVIPVGATYSLSGGTISKWVELR